jgi:hypothetical protein
MSETQYPVATICGSMRYYDEMLETAHLYTKAGWIILMPFVHVIPPDEQEGNSVKEMLDDMHFTKIAMSEAIIIVGSYIGSSTRKEIAYATEHDKKIIQVHI